MVVDSGRFQMFGGAAKIMIWPLFVIMEFDHCDDIYVCVQLTAILKFQTFIENICDFDLCIRRINSICV